MKWYLKAWAQYSYLCLFLQFLPFVLLVSVCVLLFILFVVVCGDGVLPGLTFYKVQAANYNRVSISIQIMPLLCFKGFKNSTVWRHSGIATHTVTIPPVVTTFPVNNQISSIIPSHMINSTLHKCMLWIILA